MMKDGGLHQETIFAVVLNHIGKPRALLRMLHLHAKECPAIDFLPKARPLHRQ